MPLPAHQSALFAGPGRYPALAFYRVPKDQPIQKDAIRGRAAALLREVEALELETQHVLVSVRPELVDDHPSDPVDVPDIDPGAGPNGYRFEFGSGRIAVAIQVSAETPEDRIHALRLAKHLLVDDVVLEVATEFIGDLRTSYREPFGYPDTRKGHIASDIEHAAIIEAGAKHEGASWVFFQRFVQDVPLFFTHPAPTRDAIVGIDVEGRTHTGPAPPLSTTQPHVKLMRAANRHATTGRPHVIRRGFPYRDPSGDEGLAFVGIADSPLKFKNLLAIMLGLGASSDHDALLPYAQADAGGLFFVPPSADWLAEGVIAPAFASPGEISSIARPGDEALLLYPFTPAGIAYMDRMRDELVFGNPVGRIDRVPNEDDEIASPASLSLLAMTDDVHTKMAGGDDSIDDLLPAIDQLVLDINALPASTKSGTPPKVTELVASVSNAAAGGPLDRPRVVSAATTPASLLDDAVREANTAIASNIGYVHPLVRDLINATAQVVAGPTLPDSTIKSELDEMRDAAFDASARVNTGQGYYITITG